jgi:CHAD domain-containing protein
VLAPRAFRGTLGGARVRKLLSRRKARFDDRLRAALADPSPEAAHALRRSLKQLRYLIELAGPALGRRWRDLADRLVLLQRELGALHDLDLRVSLLGPGPLRRAQQRERARLAARLSARLARWKK